MRVLALGRGLFALSGAGLAVLSLTYGEFAPMGQPLAGELVWRTGAVDVIALLVLAASGGLCFARTALPSALAIGTYLAAWLLVRAGPAVAEPISVASWYGICEAAAPLLGVGILYGLLRRHSCATPTAPVGAVRGVRAAQRLFGLACVVFGLAHFAYADYTASMVPLWLPGRRGIALATGLAHAAAGIGIAFAILPRLAATLEATMMSAFGLLVWLPTLFAHTAPEWARPPQNQWTELIVTMLLAASAWIVAASLQDHRWGLAARARPPRGNSLTR